MSIIKLSPKSRSRTPPSRRPRLNSCNQSMRKSSQWLPEDDKLLLEARAKGQGWTDIAEIFKERSGRCIQKSKLSPSSNACRKRHERITASLNPFPEDGDGPGRELFCSVYKRVQRQMWELMATELDRELVKNGQDHYKVSWEQLEELIFSMGKKTVMVMVRRHEKKLSSTQPDSSPSTRESSLAALPHANEFDQSRHSALVLPSTYPMYTQPPPQNRMYDGYDYTQLPAMMAQHSPMSHAAPIQQPSPRHYDNAVAPPVISRQMQYHHTPPQQTYEFTAQYSIPEQAYHEQQRRMMPPQGYQPAHQPHRDTEPSDRSNGRSVSIRSMLHTPGMEQNGPERDVR
ncbi:hypothetical protein BT63DRAFT_425376 [Microthyrium microscopicum]|uniref:Myb-like domain-containing protein n=1 Tax=Microthyrium microscopicum TaxID=703497 RepID=A0A6A6UDR3_9PEZI|nr:hypothetical protein BT63DRAFT_425376 [Microthyrium microscopicum]